MTTGLLIVAAVILMVVLPLVGIVSLVRWLNTKPGDRPERCGGSMGGVLLELDRSIRPSVEHRIETEHRVVKEGDNQGGE